MSLIARHLEALGIPTMCLGSALDILRAGRPPRVTLVDYPLGHTSGKPLDRPGQLSLLRRTLAGLESMTSAESIEILPDRWDAQDQWKVATQESESGGSDQRKPRDTNPQYQTDEDRVLAERG